jgi:hypothetical protein
MMQRLDLRLVLVVTWLLMHRFVLKWYKQFIGV